MAKFEITFDLDDLKRELSNIVEDINEGVEQGLEACAKEIREFEKTKIEQVTGKGQYIPTGQLKRSVAIIPLEWSPGLATIKIRPTVGYAKFVNNGTGVHSSDGQGKQDGWVYSPDGGNTFFFTLGMKPRYFVEDTYQYYKDKAPAIIEEEIYKCIRR